MSLALQILALVRQRIVDFQELKPRTPKVLGFEYKRQMHYLPDS
jgi:hypothetical protein